ncbi:hypothetical protein ALTERO38_50539 [Alteromonas sp. 38]|nr:hypothetical protein ALTER154_80729 [Alteromonas sp. 154]VXB36841.1 hypothetical protein ALTERO38_50539 [Alteromonas sp. 38]
MKRSGCGQSSLCVNFLGFAHENKSGDTWLIPILAKKQKTPRGKNSKTLEKKGR